MSRSASRSRSSPRIVLREIESGVTSVGNMKTLQVTAQTLSQMRNQTDMTLTANQYYRY